MKIVTTIFIMLGLFLGFVAYQNLHAKRYVPPIYVMDATGLTSLVNNWRKTNGLVTLTNNPVLCTLAAARANEIKTDFTHTKFYTHLNGLTAYKALFSENLARGQITNSEALDYWIASPAHLRNLKDPQLTQTCIVCKNNYCAQEFSTSF